jgi:hypothetical protein
VECSLAPVEDLLETSFGKSPGVHLARDSDPNHMHHFDRSDAYESDAL